MINLTKKLPRKRVSIVACDAIGCHPAMCSSVEICLTLKLIPFPRSIGRVQASGKPQAFASLISLGISHQDTLPRCHDCTWYNIDLELDSISEVEEMK